MESLPEVIITPPPRDVVIPPSFGKNRLIFVNKPGENALVWLVGPTWVTVEVPNKQDSMVEEVAAGRYYIKVRYGKVGNYSYMKGEEFDVVETPTSYSVTSITLHRVAGGNYRIYPISKKEFTGG